MRTRSTGWLRWPTPSFAGWRDKNGCDSGGTPAETTETYGGSSCSIDTSCAEAGVEVGLCSVRGSALGPPLDVFSGHILYINDDSFGVSQRAWEFMRDHRTTPFAPVPLTGTAWDASGSDHAPTRAVLSGSLRR